MGPDGFLALMTGILLLNYGFNKVLDYLNLKTWQNELPDSLKAFYNEEEYQKAQRYNREKERVSFWSETFNLLLMIFFLVLGGFGWLNGWLDQFFESQILLALVFFGVLFLASDLLNWGFILYDTFVIEERFGFNKMTLKTFFGDKLKGYGLALIIGGGLLALILWLILTIGANFWIYAFLVITAFSLIMNIFNTDWILPLFNKLEPLEEGPLKRKIRQYAEKVDFPLSGVYIMDGSKRSSKANAFFSGLGKKKKIVLFDTLLNDHTDEEILAILAHETGHFRKKHIPQNVGISVLQTVLMFFILSLLVYNKNLSLALGAEEWYLHLNLLAFGILYEPLSVMLGLAMNAISRKFEYEADAFAAETADKNALISALKKLSTKHLSNLTPHSAYVFVHYAHPPVLDRIKALNQY